MKINAKILLNREIYQETMRHETNHDGKLVKCL